MRKVFDDLFYGRYNISERKSPRTPKEDEVNSKIESEKAYFTEKMSEDDQNRFEELENLYTESGNYDEISAFIYGFKLGTMLMCAVFTGEGEPTSQEQ